MQTAKPEQVFSEHYKLWLAFGSDGSESETESLSLLSELRLDSYEVSVSTLLASSNFLFFDGGAWIEVATGFGLESAQQALLGPF